MDKKLLREKFEQAMKSQEEGNGQLFLYSLLDFSFTYDEENEMVLIKVPISEMMYNPIGHIHGGIFTYIADTAMGHLCAAFGERPGVSLELKTQFLRSVRSGTLTARAYFIKKGKSVQFIECIIEDDEKQTVTKTTGTFYCIE